MLVLLLGATGQVGSEVARLLAGKADVVAPSRAEADLADPIALTSLVRRTAPEAIVNAAAWTAVDRAEAERDAAFAVNAAAPEALARAAEEIGALLVHYSTDYVFDGASDRPWREDDRTGPLNVYGASKLEGERRVLAAGAHSVILRTGWVYSPRGTNFLLTMRRLFQEREEVRVVDDQIGAPTSARYVARATLAVLDRGRSAVGGIYHVAAAGEVSWFRFATVIHAALDARGPLRTRRVTAISTAEFPTPARRPRYSVLDSSKFAAEYGVVAPAWEGLLGETIAELS